MKSNDSRIGMSLYVYERGISNEFGLKHVGTVTNVIPQSDAPNLIYFRVEDEILTSEGGDYDSIKIFELPVDKWSQAWKDVIDTCDEDLRQHIGVCLQYPNSENTTLFDHRTGNTLYYIEESHQSGNVTLIDDQVYCGKGTLTHCVTRFFVGCEELEIYPEDYEIWS